MAFDCQELKGLLTYLLTYLYQNTTELICTKSKIWCCTKTKQHTRILCTNWPF